MSVIDLLFGPKVSARARSTHERTARGCLKENNILIDYTAHTIILLMMGESSSRLLAFFRVHMHTRVLHGFCLICVYANIHPPIHPLVHIDARGVCVFIPANALLTSSYTARLLLREPGPNKYTHECVTQW